MLTQGTSPCHLALTGFTHAERKTLQLKIVSLGGAYNESTQLCSHVVCKFPNHTEKFLTGCAMGKWVLKPEYILDSYSHGAWQGEEEYEWGVNSDFKLPLHMWSLLMAPRRWRLKLANAPLGAFSNWRVVILVGDQPSEVVFRRLLECGGAKVVTLPEDGSSGSSLTHILHDESECFARIVKTFQQKGIPCMCPSFIDDYLLKADGMMPDRRRSHHGFVLSGFSRKERSELSLKIATLGGVYSETKNLKQECSHVVCKIPARTEKFLVGCALGKWILRVDYINDSYHVGHWLGERKWILRVDYINDSYHVGHWLGESQYEWGPQDAPNVPPSIRWMLSAPQRLRVLNSITCRGIFHGWRAAILVKQRQSKAVFKRLLECGDAKVEELRFPVSQRKTSVLTHIFHDGSMCFADILKPYRQMGIPCLKPMYISDCLLGEHLPDMEGYRTVDGVTVWPQLSQSSLFTSQSSCSTVTSSSVTDPDLSPIRPLASKDINTDMTARTTTAKTQRTPMTPCLPVRSTNQSPISGQELQHKKKVVSSQGQNRRSHPSVSDTKLVRKTCTSRKHKPLQKGQTMLGNFCQLLRSQQANDQNIKRVLPDPDTQVSCDHITPTIGCRGQKSKVMGHFGKTKGMRTVVGKVVPVKSVRADKTGTEMSDKTKPMLTVVGRVVTVVGKVVIVKSSSRDKMGSQKSVTNCRAQHDTTAVSECDVAWHESNQDAEVVQNNSSQYMDAVKTSSRRDGGITQRKLSQNLDIVQESTLQPVEAAQKSLSKDARIVQKNLLQNVETLQKMSSKDLKIVQKNLSQDTEILEKSVLQNMETAWKSPLKDMSFVRKMSSQNMETLQKSSSQDLESAQKIFSQTLKTARNSLSQDLETVQKSLSQDLETVQKSSSQNLETARKSSSQDVEAVQKSLSQNLETAPKSSSQDVEAVQKSLSQNLETARKSSSQDVEAVQKSLSQNLETAQKRSSDTGKAVSKNLTQHVVTETSVINSVQGSVCSIPTRTVAKRKSSFDNETTKTVAVVCKKPKVCGHLSTASPLTKNTSEVKTKLCLPFSYPTCAMFEVCLDDGELFYATDIVALSVSTTRYPTARVLHLILSRILLLSESMVLSHRVHRLLHSIVWEHPPGSPSMHCVYFDTVTYCDCPAQSEHSHPTQFLFSVISALLAGVNNKVHSLNYLLCLEFLVALFEKDFNVFMQCQQLGSKDKKGGQRSSLIGQVFWPAGRMGHLNVPCKHLLSFISKTVQLTAHYKAKLLQLLNRLVAMVAEYHRLVDCAAKHPASQTQLPHTAVLFARELAYRIQGTLTDQDHAQGLREAVGGLRLPWLSLHVCQTLLDLYDDTLLSVDLRNPPLQITFSSIVNRYFYMLPRQRETAVVDDILSLDADSSKFKGATDSDGRGKMTDSMYRTRGSKMAAKSANNRNTKGETALHVACRNNNTAKVKDLLCVPGIEINCQDHSGYTPLHLAAMRGHVDCVTSLLKYKPTNSILSFLKCETVDGRPNGARLDIMSKGGATVLHAAVAENQLQVAHLLLQSGGKQLLRLCNSIGQTPLRVAVSEEMRQLLLDLQSSRKSSFSSSQESQMSQSTCESVDQSNSSSPNGAERDSVDPEVPVTREQCHDYVYLVCCLVVSYIRLHDLCHTRHSKPQCSDQAKSRLDTSATVNGGAEESTLKCLHQHVRNFQKHLRRIIGGNTLEFCQTDLIALQTIAQSMK